MLLQKMQHGIETMERTGIKQALVVPGRFDESLAWDYQTANVIDNLRACMDLCAAGRAWSSCSSRSTRRTTRACS